MEIILFSRVRDANGDLWDCNWDSPTRTGLVIAHEVGHFLGLMHSNCGGSIMGPFPAQYAGGQFTYLLAGFSISQEECEVADELSYTPTEAAVDEEECRYDPNCDPYAPCYSDPGCTCPILIDLDRNQFHLAGVDGAVFFDIDADGDQEWVTWTASGDDGFLCWDRNGNGIIDNGRELFGNSTPLGHGGIAPFGFVALAELDDPAFGGTGDGIVDARDAAYRSLCVWLDHNRNGFSEPDELSDLVEAGVVSIETEYKIYPRRDAAGNLLLYNGVASVLDTRGRAKRTATTDVYFVELDP